jgi:ADP-heptose:LPS heptosyltransferase
MEHLQIKGTKQSPLVDFNADTGKMELSGRSIPENSYEFYNPLLEWISNYAQNPKETTELKVYLEYFNTSSSKYILEVLKRLKEILKNEGTVKVLWCYDEDDEEMMETGEDYEDVTGLNFDYQEIEE